MNIPNITGILRLGKTVISANRPEILFGGSIVTTLTSVVLAAKGGYESGQQVLKAEFSDLDLNDPEGRSKTLTLKEKAQLTWKNYLPAATGTVAALGSTTGLHLVHLNDKKKMAVAALVAVQEVQASADAYIQDVKSAVEENVKLTPAKREAIDTAILEKTADRNNGVAYVQDTDGVVEELYLVRDGRTGRDIWSNTQRIEDAVNQVNDAMNNLGDVELNTFYTAAGFGNVYPEGDDWGWSGDHLALNWTNDVRDDGRPVRRFDFRNAPSASYNAHH